MACRKSVPITIKFKPRMAPVNCKRCGRVMCVILPRPGTRGWCFAYNDANRKLRGKKCPWCRRRIDPLEGKGPEYERMTDV